jgi:hypothetical protein
MPRSEDVLSIFLASPADVSDERLRLAEVVADWNRAWSRNLGLRLDLLRWEDDAYPDIGDDAQAVINQQIPPDWDLFVGIMWSRFGSPTGRSGSGTQEELERALHRHRTAPESISVLFYFKDAPISPSKIDPDQMLQVQAFKKSIRSYGLLTWDFVDTDQFEKLINLHITKHVQEWRRSKEGPATAAASKALTETLQSTQASPPQETETSAAQPDDSGYVDLLEVFTERSAEMAEIAARLTAAQHALTEQNVRGREELDALRANPSTLSTKKIRNSIARVADEMLRFTDRVEAEIPLFRSAVDASMNALTRLATLAAELYPEQTSSTKAAAIQLLTTLIFARQSTAEFKDVTAALPRMTKELNAAKRKQVAALIALVAEFENGERLLTEGLTVIDGLARDDQPE